MSLFKNKSEGQDNIFNEVNSMYESVPFPQWDHDMRYRRLPYEILRFNYMNIAGMLPNARVLDVGCGTGNRSILMAKHFGIKELVGLDACQESLKIAQQVAEEENFKGFKPIQGSLFDIPFPDGHFDVVFSWGVLHHTHSPLEGLQEMNRVCRTGGSLAFFVYNSYADWRHNLQRNDVVQNGGSTIQSRFNYALSKYSKVSAVNMSNQERSVFFDQFVHPHKTDHKISECLSWLSSINLQYSGSYPPLRISDSLFCIKDRFSMRDEFPLKMSLLIFCLYMLSFLPLHKSNREVFLYPTRFHIMLWHLIFFLQGANGMYSHGVAIAGIKK